MLILLPNEIDGLKAMEEKLQNSNYSDIAEITRRLRKRKVNISMPKFKIQSTIDLKEPLQELGVGSIFTDRANFLGIPAPEENVSLKVSEAKTKVFIQCDEEGSEAAAATGFGLTLKSGFFITQTFEANHPFMAIIYRSGTNATTTGLTTTLFVSVVHDPSQQTADIQPSARLIKDNHAGHTHHNSAYLATPACALYLLTALMTAFNNFL